MSRQCLIVSLVVLLAACASEPRSPAPILDGTSRPVAPTPVTAAPAAGAPAGSYIIKRGDTLYRIALDNGLDYKDLAAWNNLANVNDIKVGQALRLTAPGTPDGVVVKPLTDDAPVAVKPVTPPTQPAVPAAALAYPKAVRLPYTTAAAAQVAAQAEGPAVASKPQPAITPSPTPAPTVTPVLTEKPPEKHASPSTDGEVDSSDWLLPTAGKVTKSFSTETKGIDIGGKIGQPIVASGSGKIVYAGAGLRGYGKMIIIKHNNEYLTAYAHNSKLIVKEGDVVKRGEKIAEMGDSDSDQVKLHFEIRRFGKPVDPAKYIQTD
ncbi:peptidoglycan DD-metalloendopeptidase family protein [Chitinolyticbacter albus]|uniref:peptidoglycan DD-metalloendopeptidase family protein n=1 Tax=Chitinolyticbacter albus TaxID=2961951 RepID=UPI00210EF4B6|nr:peptidoglycan DD-metalloendopeptidase family protein [Chitinolyticbacter albus]